ncbi:hypothetical protein [Micropruina sonneratiae]|uniref:hypothetical protein n=1 Tax=Micropruina sonneratiae TaxID=2986940 RepID=UPI002226F695|nr:hypothetical protein [Micropruina sp. KQZ13P-5]MCW3156445.1 hypothetical protein [Micropruina sp. KQZ13P-5]
MTHTTSAHAPDNERRRLASTTDDTEGHILRTYPLVDDQVQRRLPVTSHDDTLSVES